jgi:hypothetical protein
VPLPSSIRVKLSSEAVEAISLTPVVVQELPIRDLIQHVLGITGKDEARIRELLLRGTLVSGASRFRWAGFDAELEAIRETLRQFPDPDPSIPFDRDRCTRVILRGGRVAIDIPREAVSRRSLFRRDTFWDLLMTVLSAPAPTYAGFSYRDSIDRYVRELTVAASDRLREGSSTVKYSTLRDQIRSVAYTQGELHMPRRE